MALARLASTFGRVCRPAPQLFVRNFHLHVEGTTRAAQGLRMPKGLVPAGETKSGSLVSNAGAHWRRTFASEPVGSEAGTKTSASLTQGLANALARVPQAAYNVLPGQAQTLVDASRRPGAFQRVISLQLDSFWQRHARKVYVVGGVFVAYALWRTMYGITSTFINLSETMAAGGFLALSASIVILGALYLNRKYTIDPAVACRLAMTKLNTHPGVLEVMGAPLVSSPVRASVITGGGLRFKGLTPRIRSRRAQIIFPLTGSERRGLVSIEAKKRKGQYVFKLIAVDVPTLSGAEQRIYIEGGPAIYQRGGILDELRDPFLRAVASEDAFLKEDDADDEAEEREEQAEALAAKPKPLEQGGGMYFWERVSLGFQQLKRRLQAPSPLPEQPKKA